jgi:hypothetical protein
MSEEKDTKHNVIVRLLCESPITYSAATFALAKSIDKDTLEDEGLLVVGYDFDNAESETRANRDPSAAASKIRGIASRSPGALGDLYAFIKNYKWWQIYIGACGVILAASLIFKLLVRTVTGNW